MGWLAGAVALLLPYADADRFPSTCENGMFSVYTNVVLVVLVAFRQLIRIFEF